MSTPNDIFRRYLLDEATDDERIAIEERFMKEDAAYDEMLAVEDELFYEYKENEMTPSERSIFERKFLADREGRDRLAFAGAFLETTRDIASQRAFAAVPEAQPGIFKSIAAFFSFGKAMQVGMAAAALVVTLGVIGLLIQNQRTRNDIAAAKQAEIERLEREAQIAEKQRQQKEIDDQLAAEREKKTLDDQRIKELEDEKIKLQNDINERRRKSEPAPNVSRPGGQSTIASLIISPGHFVRSDGVPMNTVKLSPASTELRMTLRLKNVGEYVSFDTVISMVDNEQMIQSKTGLKPTGKGNGRKLNLSIPAKNLKRVDYEIILNGTTKTGEIEPITSYYFSVDK